MLVTSAEFSRKLLLVNIYNANVEREQLEILNALDAMLNDFVDLNEHELILGGDWNFILNRDLDALGGRQASTSTA